MSARPDVRHIFNLLVGGGERHRYAILLAAEVAAAKGWHVSNMQEWTQSDARPDLVIRKKDRFVKGATRDNGAMTYWLEIIDTHDPSREWKMKGLPCDDVLKIHISNLTLDEVVEKLKEQIP